MASHFLKKIKKNPSISREQEGNGADERARTAEPLAYQASALPTVPHQQMIFIKFYVVMTTSLQEGIFYILWLTYALPIIKERVHQFN